MAREKPKECAERMSDHGPQAYWDNLGDGWRIECLCGWISSPDCKLEYPAIEFDEHLEEIRESSETQLV